MSTTQTSLGVDFAQAFGARDRERIRELMGEEFDFKALTPRRTWEAADADALNEILFDIWMTDDDEIRAIEKIERDMVVDSERVGYRFRVANAKGEYVVEQQAYLREKDGRIALMRVVCSGWRKIS